MPRTSALITFTAAVTMIVVAPTVRAERAKARVAKIGPSSAQSKVGVHQVKVDGALDPARARAALEKALPRFRQCFIKAKSSVPARTVDLRLLVRPNGKVVGATVERPSSESTRDLRRCVQGRAMDIRFPAKGQGHSTVRAALGSGATPGILGLLRSNAPIGAFGKAGKITGGFGKVGRGAGGLGLRGSGRGGGGSGSPSKTPTIRTGSATVRGSLSKEVIRRVIRRHINQIRFCYERELTKTPALAGRVSIRFIISKTGAVTSAGVATSTIKSAPVEQCVSKVVQRLKFPSPAGGGVVIVTYPFMFSTAH